MKKLMLLAFLLPLFVTAQRQFGYVKTCGSPQKKGSPVEGVSIVAEDGTNSTMSSKDGTFVLTLKNKTVGKPYRIKEIYKNSYVLSDRDFCKRTFVYSSDVPLEITMISRAELAKIQGEMEENIRMKIEKNYSDKMNELESELKSRIIEFEEYKIRLAELDKKKESTKELIEMMVEEYSRVDFDRLDSINACIVNCIRNGDLLTAKNFILSKGDLDDRFIKVQLNEAKLVEDKKRIEKEAELNNQLFASNKKDKDDLASDLNHLFNISIQNFRFDSAAFFIKKRAMVDTTDFLRVWECFNYLDKQLRPIEAEYYLQILLRQPDLDSANRALVLNDLALCHSHQKKTELSQEEFEEALRIRLALESKSPDKFMASAALALGNYGASMAINGNDLEGIRYRKLASKKWKILSKKSDLFKASLAFSYIDIGMMRKDLGQYSKANTYLIKGIRIYNDIMEKYPSIFNTIPNLSLLEYEDILHKKNPTESYSKECLMILRSSAEVSKQTLAEAYYALGLLYLQKNEMDVSIRTLKKSYVNYNDLSKIYHRYSLDKIKILSELGNLYNQKNNSDSASICFKEGIDICKSVNKDNYEVKIYKNEWLAWFLMNLSQIYINSGRSQEAYGNLLEEISVYRSLIDIDSVSYTIPLAKAHLNLSLIQFYGGEMENANEHISESIELLLTLSEHEENVDSIIGEALSYKSLFKFMFSEYGGASEVAMQALAYSPENIFANRLLALSQLYQGNFEEAKHLFSELKDLPYQKGEKGTYKELFLKDFNDLEQAGITHPDVAKIRELLNE